MSYDCDSDNSWDDQEFLPQKLEQSSNKQCIFEAAFYNKDVQGLKLILQKLDESVKLKIIYTKTVSSAIGTTAETTSNLFEVSSNKFDIFLSTLEAIEKLPKIHLSDQQNLISSLQNISVQIGSAD